MPAFVSTDEAAATAAKRAADTATDNRRAECGNGDPKQRGSNCRQREVDEKEAADKFAAASSAKAATERSANLEANMSAIRQRLASRGPVVTVNVQGSALARLFRLPDTEADFAATVQQFGMAAIVELLIAFALIAWEMLRPAGEMAPRPTKEVDDQPVELAQARYSFKAAPKPKLVSSRSSAGSVSDYVLGRLEATRGCEIEFGEAYVDYTVWCKARHLEPLLPELFAEAMKPLCAEAQVSIKRKGGSAVFVGVRLAASA